MARPACHVQTGQRGLDDDNRTDTDDVAILTHEQEKAKALAALDSSAEGKPYSHLTVSRAVANYMAIFGTTGAGFGGEENEAALVTLARMVQGEVQRPDEWSEQHRVAAARN